MRSIAGGMRWPIALMALLLALIGFWSVRGRLNSRAEHC